MNILSRLLVVSAISVAATSAAHAHGDVGWSVSIGNFAPAPIYYAAPPVVYYDAPTVYYRAAPTVIYSAPVHGYYRSHSYGRWGNGWGNGGGRGDRCERPRRGWR